ncbi:MAG: polyphosphate polymerase domain-containing protein [Clostridiales bacterium]|nr:polyphosphate polymerase domain-containing protein [Clostridiales bacterium]
MDFRNELKHYINYYDYLIIKGKISKFLSLDKNVYKNSSEYKIRSIYFDNFNDKVLKEKLLGLNKRDKFRIRLYNDDDTFIKLEKKSKINGLCKKVSCDITKEEVLKIINNDIGFLINSNNKLFQELYFKMKTEFLKPKTIVDYDREAYIYNVGNVRLTFDKNLKTGIVSTNIFNSNLETINPINKDYIIFEVKYDEFLPEVISNFIQLGERTKTSISKYALCRIYG